MLDASHAWAEYDRVGDDERIAALLKANGRVPALVVTTGTVPHVRRHLYFKLDGTVTPEQLEGANTALRELLGSDAVQDAPRVMRLAGTINYPSPKKKAKGYVPELVTLHIKEGARAYKADELIGLAPASGATNPTPTTTRQAAQVEPTMSCESCSRIVAARTGTSLCAASSQQ